MLARSKLNSIESKISKTLWIMKLIMKTLRQSLMKKKCRELKESIRMMNSHRSDAEKVSLIKEDKKIDINVVIKRNEIINNSLK